MQFTTTFFALASALLFVLPAVNAIACDPLSACNDKNHYNAGHSCKYYVSACTGDVIEGYCVSTSGGLVCQ
ncbi:uncharacterized protein STEHIDRAFT_155083 [Stereum hirsutum FP-91666 SS1]|uniref:uncharacterized protein n=1 Tax=Stereum hirsutum (strain FP-91666) TaxID=721885 RepID=UPI000440DE95|nr:uncharacterized protein STEHIDRAFT_155083 [Stereum hirsutum FP-91666 SS1]EIM89421.1 hypothetical protein STEHIDRAFT_155083 [Stereum hirsutum FP-91666 SS1]